MKSYKFYQNYCIIFLLFFSLEKRAAYKKNLKSFTNNRMVILTILEHLQKSTNIFFSLVNR